MGIGVYRCERCFRSYSKSEVDSLSRNRKKQVLCRKKVKDSVKRRVGGKETTVEVEKKEGCGGLVKEVEPVRTQKLTYSEFQAGVERFYYDILGRMHDKDYDPEKIKDVYTASEASDFWTEMERRKQAQAEQAMRYLGTIGAMTKTIFQLIRELRIVDQRLTHYKGRAEGNESDDVALKGLWIDKVEGGTQKTTSVYGMAMQLGFATLPDLFYKLFPKKMGDVDKLVDSLQKDVNKAVRNVLKRKLTEFMNWLERTKVELDDGRKFKLAYLRQHFHLIRMYLEWTKPYLENTEALSGMSASSRTGRAKTELIRAAEGAVIDLELFGKNINKKWKDNRYSPAIRVVFHYNTIPQMLYTKQYQKGAIHTGMTAINFEAYILTDADIEKFKTSDWENDVAVLAAVNSAIFAYKKELLEYLVEAEDEYAKKALEAMGPAVQKKKEQNKYGRISGFKLKKMKDEATAAVKEDVWKIYDDFKKNFGMIRW